MVTFKIALVGCICLARVVAAAGTTYNIAVSSTGGNRSSPLMYGLMFEDINYSGDGGLYAELIKNRAFQGNPTYPSSTTAYSSVGGTTLIIDTAVPLSSALPNSMKVSVPSTATGQVGFLNSGYWGIGVSSQTYRGSFYVRGAYSGAITAALQSTTGTTWASATVQAASTAGKWTQYNYTLHPSQQAPDAKNTLVITFDAKKATAGALNFQLISLFPPTYKNRPNGLRVDLMNALKALNPSFLRFPGGNNLEGNQPPNYLHWNLTIGPLTDRPGRPGTWGYENTDGLGLVEYFDWCTDLNLEPILAVWSGFYLWNIAIPEADLGPYVQDALNELEFVLGPATSKWGAKRAALGYPNPWKLKYVEIGNEDNLNGGNTTYNAYRFRAFYDAIHKAYPSLTIISSGADLGNAPAGVALDYHIYSRPDNFVGNFNAFDNFRPGYKVLVGEYANVQPNEQGKTGVNWGSAMWQFPQWVGSVAEAVFLLGTERNAGRMLGNAYAPALQNLNNYQWSPDMISFTADPRQNVFSTSYHVLQLLSSTRGTDTLPTTSTAPFGPLYYAASLNNRTGSHILKLATYNATAGVDVAVTFQHLHAGTKANLTVLTAPSGPFAYNSPWTAQAVVGSTTQVVSDAAGTYSFRLGDYSVAVLQTA